MQAQNGQSTTYTYGTKGGNGETQGQLKARTVPGAQSVRYTRNDLGQVTGAETRDGSNQLVVTYAYDYDPAKRLNSVTDSRGNKQLTYTWTPGGRLAKVVDSDGHSTSFAYDSVGRLASLTAPNNETISFVWDAGGRLIEKRLNSGLITTQSWFEDGSLKEKTNRYNASTLSRHVYTLDSQGRRASHAETVNGTTKTWTYQYDHLDRLTSASDGTAETYSYDITGNRRSKTQSGQTTAYLYDLAHQLSEIRQSNDTGTLIGAAIHDADGHLSKLCEGTTATKSPTDCSASGTGATTLQLAWNALDHLLTATRTGTNAVAESYAYDDSGRRLKKTSASSTTHYLYDGDAIHAEWATALSGLPSAVYAHGAGIDEAVLRLTGSTNSPSATQTTYLQDGLGSVIGLANSTGTLTASQRFDAWGNRTTSSGTTPTYGFTGREPDQTGLIFYRARYYHAGIGRFTSRDPAGMADAISPYAYVANSPTNFVDPMGWLASDPVRLAQLSGLSKYWGAIGETMTDAGNGLYNSLPSQQSVQNFLDKSQTALDYAGLAAQGPLEVVAPFIDAASAGVSLLRGDYAGAGLSGLGAIPVIGSIANAAKVGRGIDNAADAAKGVGARVEAVHGALDPIAAGRRTTAALDTVEGTRVLAAGGRDLSPAQRALMVPGEVGAKLPGAHAEVTALQHAAQNGLTPAEMAVSRTICPTCRAAIEQSGGQLTSPTTAIWPR